MKMFSPLTKGIFSENAFHFGGIHLYMKSVVATATLSLSFLFIPAYSQSIVNPTSAPVSAVAVSNPPSYWLIVRYGDGSANSLEKVEMQSMEQCELQGAVWRASKRISPGALTAFECLEGK